MTKRTLAAALAALALLAEAAGAQMGPSIRSFGGFRLGGGSPRSGGFGTGGGFEMDPKVADGYWIGPASSYQELELPRSPADASPSQGLPDPDDPSDMRKVKRSISAVRAAVGRDKLEVGAIIPYIRDDVARGNDAHGFGDIQIYGKAVPVQLEGFSVGLGMSLLIPSGDEDKNLGYGEVGFLPFVSAALRIPGNPLELRGGFAYRFFANDGPDLPSRARGDTCPPEPSTGADTCNRGFGRIPPNSFVYRAGAFFALNQGLGVRMEFAAEKTDVVKRSSPMSIEPGLDIRVPAKVVDIIFQPTGMVGLNTEAPDWGIGMSFSVTTPYQAPKGRGGLPF